MAGPGMIEIEGLQKRFGRFDAVRGLDLSVPEGSAFALIGAKGASKTTTIKTAMNILEPDQGRVTVMGVDSRRLAAPDYAKIGYVSENQDLPEGLTVGQFLAYLRPFYPAWDRALEAEVLGQSHLPPDRKIRNLSHGMRMKLALAGALAFRPRLLILDEPFSGLDPLVRDEFMELLLGQVGDTTLLISSHELGEIEGVATHVGFIDQGRLLFQEPLEDLRARTREVRVTLDGDARLPAAPPAEWLDLKVSGSVVSFVDTRFDETRLRAQAAALLGPARHLDIRPVELRAIFTTIARSMRKEAA
ncbi:MAG: ABC transporter ATP-binding protein [Caulobacteraceae bacterium]